MKKKIVLMVLMLISMILIMGGNDSYAITRRCQNCGATVTGYYADYNDSSHTAEFECDCGWTDREFYSHQWGYHAQGSTYPETRCGYKKCNVSGCGRTDGWNHTWSVSGTTSATCTEAGTITYVCSNNEHTSTVTGDPATGHSYGSWQTYTSGTCQRQSVERRYCTNSGCSSYEERTGSYGNHNYSQSCPTCGTANVKCSICGDIKSHTCLQAPTVTMKLQNGTDYNGEWTNKNVVVTLSSTTATSYEYSTDGSTWLAAPSLTMNGTTGTVTFSTEMNATVYFRTVNDSARSGKTAGHNIKIDKTAPGGTININKIYGKYVNSNNVTINIAFTDNYSTASEMKVSLINSADFSESKLNSSIVWEEYAETKPFTLTEGEGLRKVYAIFKDAAGNQSVYLVQ